MFYSFLNKMQAMPASILHLCLISFICTGFMGLQSIMSIALYADSSLSFTDNMKRVKLANIAVNAPHSIADWDGNDIQILLRKPSLRRAENKIAAWHYHGESCALDLYFSDESAKPDYIEYRALTLNNDVQEQFGEADTATLNQYCIKDVLEAQGLKTPSNVARRPIPTLDNRARG